MYMMSQVAITLKAMAKDFNIAALVRTHIHPCTRARRVARRHSAVSATSAGDQPRDKECGGRGAAWPGRVVESRPQNPSPAGATPRRQHRPTRSTLRHPHQVLQAGKIKALPAGWMYG